MVETLLSGRGFGGRDEGGWFRRMTGHAQTKPIAMWTYEGTDWLNLVASDKTGKDPSEACP